MMHELSAENVVEYARSHGWIGPGEASAEWLSGGVSNCVLRVEQEGRRIIVKQSRPRLRTERAWFSDIARIHREEDVQRLLSEKLPGSVPRVLGSDRDNYAYAMQHAPDDARTWKERLLAGELSLTTARAAGQLLGRIHALTIDDPRLADGEVFRQLRIEPFYDRVAAVHPDLEPTVRSLIHAMTSLPAGLCHGDYSPKNLLVADESMMLVDHETAYLGEPAMDLGFFFSHLLLKAIRMPGWRGAMVGLIRAALGAYSPKGDVLWRGLGHLGVCLLARVDGTSPVDYLPSPRHQEAARRLGRKILLQTPYDWETVLGWAEDEVRDLEG